MLGTVRFRHTLFQHPRFGGLSINAGLHGGERLGADDKQSRFRIDHGQSTRQIRRVNIDDIMSSEIITLVRTQTIQCGLDAKIRTTDTDVDNMFDTLACPALPLTRVHLLA